MGSTNEGAQERMSVSFTVPYTPTVQSPSCAFTGRTLPLSSIAFRMATDPDLQSGASSVAAYAHAPHPSLTQMQCTPV